MSYWDSSSTGFDEEYALSVLCNSLPKELNKKIPIQSVRPLMVQYDIHFAKQGNDTHKINDDRNKGWIHRLVEVAVRKGLLKSYKENNPSNYTSTSTATIYMIELTPQGLEFVNRHKLSPHSNAPLTESPLQRVMPLKSGTLSNDYLEFFKENNLGPFGDIRASIWSDLSKELMNYSVITAITHTLSKYKGATTSSGNAVPVRFLRSFIFKILYSCEVLVKDGVAYNLSPDILNQSGYTINVQSIEDETVKLLILKLIDSSLDVTIESVYDLAGAIYQKARTDEYVTLISNYVGELFRARVIIENNGMYITNASVALDDKASPAIEEVG